MAKVMLKDVRLSFPDLFEPTSQDGGPLKYGAVLLFDPLGENDKALRATMKQVAIDKWGAKGEQTLKAALATNNNQRVCLYSGDTKEYDGYAGMMCLTAKRSATDGAPAVIDRDRTPLSSTAGRPYAGCYVNAQVDIWAQDNKHGKTLRATLLAVQFYRDGDAFSAVQSADVDEFEDLGTEGEDGGLA